MDFTPGVFARSKVCNVLIVSNLAKTDTMSPKKCLQRTAARYTFFARSVSYLTLFYSALLIIPWYLGKSNEERQMHRPSDSQCFKNAEFLTTMCRFLIILEILEIYANNITYIILYDCLL